MQVRNKGCMEKYVLFGESFILNKQEEKKSGGEREKLGLGINEKKKEMVGQNWDKELENGKIGQFQDWDTELDEWKT